jgi:hypothetical protein
MDSPNFKDFFLGLGVVERQAFASRAGTTVGYVQTHLIYARKVPRRPLLDALVIACAAQGGPSRQQLLAFFYDQGSQNLPIDANGHTA